MGLPYKAMGLKVKGLRSCSRRTHLDAAQRPISGAAVITPVLRT
jgi:hypothetical protein